MARSEVQIEPASGLRYGQTSIPAVATLVVTSTDPYTRAVAVKAKTANTQKVYIGDSAVSAATGFELGAGESLTVDVNNRDIPIYAISASGTQAVCWMVLS